MSGIQVETKPLTDPGVKLGRIFNNSMLEFPSFIEHKYQIYITRICT